MLETGAAAPDFGLPGVRPGVEGFDEYRLDDHTDAGAVVLAFYPFDFSPVCTESLCAFRDAEWLTVTDDVDVWAISRDSCYAHRRFAAANSLTFPLLSDVTGDVCAAYDVVYDELERHPAVPKRAVFIVDADRTVRYAWSAADAYQSPRVDALARELEAICPTAFET